MRDVLYDLQEKGILDVNNSRFESNCKKEGSFDSNEPISVLDKRRSPSPSTSTSTHSYATGGGGGSGGGSSSTDNIGSIAAVSDTTLHQKWPTFSALPEMGGSGGRKDEWVAELQPISAGLEVGVWSSQRFGLGLEDWESLLSESEACHVQDQSLLRWISGDVEDTSFSLKQLLQGGNGNEIDESPPVGPLNDQRSLFETSAPGGNLVTQSQAFPATISLPAPTPNLLPFANPDQKTQPFNPQFVLNPNQTQPMSTHANLSPFPDHFQPHPKRHNPGYPKAPFPDPGHHFPHLGLSNHPLQRAIMVPKQELMLPPVAAAAGHQQVVYDQLYSAAELILAGNFTHAQGILARLNHQLTPMANPFQRAAFYFKEALQLPLLISTTPANLLPPPQRIPTPFDGMFKMGAYKVLSEISPLIQFMNFTANQTILEAIEDAQNIHIVDFDIGFGAQWSSFMQELPRKNNGGSSSLKITAFASPSTHHPIELELMHENLSQFAREIGLAFELEVVNFDSFDPSSFSVSGNKTVAVNFPIWSCATHFPAMPSLLRFIKQLSPRIVVSLDRGCERMDLPFPQHLLHCLQYHEVLLDSIQAANVTSDTANKIEKFLFQPKIESMVIGRLQAVELMHYWRTLFTSSGYYPVALSNFAETQAECVVKRTHIRGFHVEKRQASLVLSWQNRELMSASAWKC